jgi:hypothetical protein
MRKKKHLLEKKQKKIKMFRKKLKYFELLKIKNYTKILSSKISLIRYNYFRKGDFVYKLPKFTFYKKKFFSLELAEIMFGFGDSENPLKKTVLFIEKLILNFFHNLVASITYIAFWRNRKRPTIDDLLFCSRNRTRSLSRIKYLMKMKTLIEKIMGPDKKNNSIKEKGIFQFNFRA